MDLFGAEEIVEALLEHGESDDETRSFEERYNIIVEAIYGGNAKQYQIRKPAHRPKERSEIEFDLLLVEMHEAYESGNYSSYKDLADDFIDQTNYAGIRENAVKRLAQKFSNNHERISKPDERSAILELVKIQKEQWGYSDQWYSEMRRLKQALSDNGWPVWVDYE